MHGRAATIAIRLTLLATLAAATSFGSAPAGAAEPLFDDPAFERAVDRAENERAARDRARRSEEARQRRDRSRREHQGLGDRRAIGLAKAKFAPAAAQASRAGVGPLGDRTRGFVDDHTVVVDNGDGEPRGLMSSVLPLRVRRDGRSIPVDLTLERRSAGFGAVAPLVPLRIGARAGDALSLLPSGVGVGLGGDGATEGILESGRVFYPNVATDTDAWLTPTMLGAEIFWQLRSPRSTEALELELTLPAGADARLTRPAPLAASPMSPPADPWVEIRRGSEVVALIEPPSAFDAAGTAVDASYELDGSRLTVRVRHREEDLEYPIAVDPPVADTYGFGDTNFTGGWNGESNKGDHFWWEWYYGVSGWEHGLHVGQHGGFFNHGEYGGYGMWAPGHTSYIYGADMEGVHHDMPDPHHLTQNFYSGLGDAGRWQSLVDQAYDFRWHYRGHCANGATWQEEWNNNWPNGPWNCPANAVPHNKLAFGAWIRDTGWRTSQGHLMVRDARVYMSDPEAPSGVSVSGIPTSAWRDDQTYTSQVSASDPGLGIRNLYIVRADNGAVVGSHHQGTGTCGGRYSRCSPSGTWGVTYRTSGLPEGLTNLRGRATDPIEHAGQAASTFPVRVDRSKPTLSKPSGTLYDARNQTDDHRFEGLYGDAYAVRATASDAYSGLRDIEVFMTRHGGTRESQRARGGYTTTGTLDWTMRPDDYADGTYTVEVVARDNVQGTTGADDSRHVAIEKFDVTVDRRGDVYNASELDADNPADNYPTLAREWAQLGTPQARREEDGYTATRHSPQCGSTQCGEIREVFGADFPGQPAGYKVTRANTANHSGLDAVAEIQLPAQRQDAPESTGPIAQAAKPLQTLPPAHGSTYAFYREVYGNEEVDDEQATTEVRLWVDEKTKLPLRQLTVLKGEVERDLLYTYGRERAVVADLPAGHFAATSPAGAEILPTTELGNEPAAEDDSDAVVEEEPSQEEIARSTTFRERFGLNVLNATLLMAQPEVAFEDAYEEYGVRLTDVELAELRERERAVDALSEVYDWIFRNNARTYAGTYIDQTNGGLVYIGFTKNAELHLNDLKAIYDYPARLRTFTATLSRDELDALQSRVEADMDLLQADGVDVVGVGVDPETNAVVVTVPVPDPVKQQKLTTRYGTHVQLRQGEALTARAKYKGYYSRVFKKTPPWYAGVGIGQKYGAIFAECTAAFTVRKGNKWRKLTAGHCGPRGSYWVTAYKPSAQRRIYQNQGSITARALAGGTSMDVAQIKTYPRLATSRVYSRPGTGDRYRRMTRQAPFREGTGEGRDGKPKGTKLCFAGMRHKNPQCGDLVYENYSQDDYLGHGKIYKQKVVAVASLGGDSGAPFYRTNTAWGILGGGGSITDTRGRRVEITSFTPISNVTLNWGTTIVGRTLPRTP